MRRTRRARRRRPPWSRRLHVGEVLGAMLAQDVPRPAALLGAGRAEAREQLALPRDRLVGYRPTHDQALEQQLDGALPGVLARERVAGERFGVLAPAGRRQRPAQRQDIALGVGVA